MSVTARFSLVDCVFTFTRLDGFTIRDISINFLLTTDIGLNSFPFDVMVVKETYTSAGNYYKV